MGFRTQWYAEQQGAAEAEEEAVRIARMPVGRKRRPPNAPATWNALRALSTKLTRELEDLLKILHESAPGERMPEITVTMTTDLAQSPPETIEPPTRSKLVSPMGRHRIALGGKVEQNIVAARIEISAKLTVWAVPGKGDNRTGMNRSTWIMPPETAEKREKRYEKLHREK